MGERARAGWGLTLAVAATAVLVFFAALLIRLNVGLGDQAATNATTVAATGDIVAVSRSLAGPLDEIEALAADTSAVTDAASSITPLLERLRDALGTAASSVGRAGEGARMSQANLAQVASAVDGLAAKTAALASAAAPMPAQEKRVVAQLSTIAGHLEEAVADARRIRQLFDPGPPA